LELDEKKKKNKERQREKGREEKRKRVRLEGARALVSGRDENVIRREDTEIGYRHRRV
jgi:hypothetical protein